MLFKTCHLRSFRESIGDSGQIVANVRCGRRRSHVWNAWLHVPKKAFVDKFQSSVPLFQKNNVDLYCATHMLKIQITLAGSHKLEFYYIFFNFTSIQVHPLVPLNTVCN